MKRLAIKCERLIPGYNHDVMHKKIQKLVFKKDINTKLLGFQTRAAAVLV